MNRDYGDDIHLLPLVMTRLHMTTGGCEVIVRDGMQSLSCRWWKLKAIELPRWLCWSSQCTAQSLISTSVQSLINTSAESLIGTSTGASSAHLQEPASAHLLRPSSTCLSRASSTHYPKEIAAPVQHPRRS